MARRVNVNDEPYAGFLPESQIPQCLPNNIYYTTDSRCKRYFCAVCSDCHPVNVDETQRLTEWLTGRTLPDALHRSKEADIIDNYTQMRFKLAREIDNHPCTITYHAIKEVKEKANALHSC
ncbi:hypothetical protein FBUS_09859 [Fasciolopsis buskii]|uniref:Uncharacterized protein n=1 Tax=Fasciolopsis buskii TaxID=27845 RepID=A0A8E0S4Z9_9TREM|nr:hypothetical protein FBUS_09859 [Fasciolopsis buski]